MPKVAKITRQKKNPQRYNVFFDQGGQDVYGFSVEEETLITERISKGHELDQGTIDALLAKDTVHKGYGLALTYLGYRMRSIKEMKQYLTKKEIEPVHISVIIDRLLDEKLLDDLAYAKAFVRTKVHTLFKGPLLIKKELIEKGVNQITAEQALDVYTEEEQLEKVVHWLEKQKKKTKKLSHQQNLMKQKQTLVQKGFSRSIIDKAFSQVEQEKDQEAEWQAVVTQGQKILRRYARKSSGFELNQKVKAALYQKGFSFDEIDRFLNDHIEGN